MMRTMFKDSLWTRMRAFWHTHSLVIVAGLIMFGLLLAASVYGGTKIG